MKVGSGGEVDEHRDMETWSQTELVDCLKCILINDNIVIRNLLHSWSPGDET